MKSSFELRANFFIERHTLEVLSDDSFVFRDSEPLQAKISDFFSSIQTLDNTRT